MGSMSALFQAWEHPQEFLRTALLVRRYFVAV